MKTLKLARILALGLVVTALSSCGKIPRAYQGTFLDTTTGAQLTLGDSDGKWSQAGRQLEAKADSAKFEDLMQGKPGIYLQPVPGNEKVMRVFWVIPDVSSKQATPELVWFKAEFLDTRMVADASEPVSDIHMEYCKDGLLMLAPQTQTMNGGCGPDTVPVTLSRVKQ